MSTASESEDTTEPAGGPEAVGALAGRVAGKAGPLYLSMLATMAGGMVTAGVLGNAGTAQLAAYAVVIAVFNPVLMVVQGALRGSMPFVAEHGDDPRRLAPVVRDSLWLALAMGALGGLLVATAPLWGRLAGVAAPTLAALGPYPLLMGLYVVVASVKASVTVLLTGLGHNRAVLALSLVTTALAVVLVPALVLGPGPVPAMGLPGAGSAVLLHGCATVCLSLYVARRVTVLRGRPIGLGAPRWAGVRRIARVGLPTGSTLLVKFGAMGVLALAAARIGPAEAAAHQLLVVVATFVFLAAAATGQATVPFTARAAGRGDRAGVRRSVLAGYLVAVPVVAVSATLVWAASGTVVGLFTDDPEVAALVTALLPVLCAVAVADAAQALPGMGLLGIKKARSSMHAFAVCYGLLALVAVPVAGAGGLTSLWAVYAVATAGLVVGQGLAFRRLSARV
ncbi:MULTISPECIES: MATE family efflux transporter [Nocardiopsis]|uniref:Probable multidrug resistance protein NorM n=1 Tax=Nocardiopsis sinuspersici TaxID=501010 RepID=A0A1V3C259_9ACTN|nr:MULTISPECIES: MATE family efflux transporter [Nocardiopsis]OOC54891.1 matE family protein [Nocardiopsis sinuspersici]